MSNSILYDKDIVTSYYYAVYQISNGFSIPNDDYYFTNIKFHSLLYDLPNDTTNDISFNISSNYFQLYIIFDFISPAICIRSNDMSINDIDINIDSSTSSSQVCTSLTKAIDYTVIDPSKMGKSNSDTKHIELELQGGAAVAPNERQSDSENPKGLRYQVT